MSGPLVYTPPPTVKAFIKDHRKGALFYDWIVGPVGSGKTTGIFFKLLHMAQLQAPGPDGIRRSRAAIIRNTAPQLRDTTLASWFTWFKDGQAGTWRATEKNFTLRFNDVECEVLFRPLDTPDDVARVLSLELTFAIIDEFVQIPRAIIDALSARVGRFPSQKDGGATNYGLWGSSNSSTEDNWWFEYLHNPQICVQPADYALATEALAAKYQGEGQAVPNATYFVQPSGFSPEAENLANLPGGRGYYTNQAQGKKPAWVKQFIESEWGFSAVGQPVVATFNADLHVVRSRLLFDPQRPLIIGLDPGITGTALIFGQDDLHDRVRVLGELILTGVGAQRMVTDYLKPYLAQHFPGAQVIIAPDPAASNRAQTDEKSVVDVLRKHFAVKVETNNRLGIRLDAIERYTTRLTDVGPALLVEAARCPVLIRALKGGWRYIYDPKKDDIRGVEPEKNAYSHPGDAFGYLLRYFSRQNERALRHTGNGRHPGFVIPRQFGPSYHHR
jgi:hypothetical protein